VTTKEILEAAKARIDTPEKWCQGILSLDGRRCAMAAFEGWETGTVPLYDLLAKDASYGTPSLVEFNDTHTHAEVMALFDRAIAEAS
jgi:hypothetical protein